MRSNRAHGVRRDFVGLVHALVLLSCPCWAQLTRRVNFTSDGGVPNGPCFSPVISADGRFVAFWSEATNIVPGDTNGVEDIFVYDRWTGRTERASVGSNGEQGNQYCLRPWISGDGRYVTFDSESSNLVPGDTNAQFDVFVRDRWSGTTARVSVASDGTEANGGSGGGAQISADGRFVAFWSAATNLVSPDANGTQSDVLVHDLVTGSTTRVSVSSGGAQGDQRSDDPCLSADGRFVAFRSSATNLVPGDTNGWPDIFVHDRATGETERVSVGDGGIQANEESWLASLSADGRYVGFGSMATNLVAGDTNLQDDAFVHDRVTGTTVRVNVGPGGVEANGWSDPARISLDGRYALFGSWATNLVSGDTNGTIDLFLRDLREGTTELVTVAFDGGASDDSSSSFATISGDGRFVAFQSDATNLVPGGPIGTNGIFVRDRHASGFASLCDPGLAGVVDCPCANPPAGRGRGCDNSSATGGAVLSASGFAYLTQDELVFTASGETPEALSILLQGDAPVPSGHAFGQGVRCVGGAILRRLYSRVASGGGVTLPDSSAGDPVVSVRSGQKGDLIRAGQSRWYVVYYRDGANSLGCPSSLEFNATQTGRVDWSL